MKETQNSSRKHEQLKIYEDGNPRVLDFVFMRRRAEELENVSRQEAPRKPQKALEMKILPAQEALLGAGQDARI